MNRNVDSKIIAKAEWADAEVGQLLAGDHVTVDWNTVVMQVSGSQDWNRVHHDPDFARESGHPSVFLNTGWTSAMLYKVASDWIGSSGWVQHFDFRMRQMNAFGDAVTSGGQVREKRIDPEGRPVVELDLWLDNDRVGRTTVASATVVLLTSVGGVE